MSSTVLLVATVVVALAVPRPPAAQAALPTGIVPVATGTSHSCGLTAAGGVVCWGLDQYDQLGTTQTSTKSAVPLSVDGLASGVRQVTAGKALSCALKASGAVACWGTTNTSYPLFNPYFAASTPRIPTGWSSGLVAISSGANNVCALRSSGAVSCLSANGSVADVASAGSDNTSVAAGDNHTCVVKSDGSAWCWGSNASGQVGVAPTSNVSTATQVAGLAGVVQVSGGELHTCALLDDTTVRCWGRNTEGQLGDGTTTASVAPVAVSGLTGVTSLVAGGRHTCAITTGGAVTCWGQTVQPDKSTTVVTVPTAVPSLSSGVTAIDVGPDDACALRGDGSMTCWGTDPFTYGRLGNRPNIGGFSASTTSAVTTGTNHTCAVSTDGAARCWGSNTSGQLGNGSTTSSLVAVDVAGISSGATAIDGGATHTCAVVAGGVSCWGANASGQLGNGSTTASSVPVTVVGLPSAAVSVTAGTAVSCAALEDGTAWCWGRNDFGQLGSGTISPTPSAVPVQVVGVSGVVSVAMGISHVCALTSSGGVWCWGENQGALGNGTTATSGTPVAVTGLSSGVAMVTAGSVHSCAVTTAGAALCWGRAGSQLGSGNNAVAALTPVGVVGLSSGMASISAGDRYTCGVTTSGTVKCWGTNTSGQTGITSGSTGPVDLRLSDFPTTGYTAIAAGGTHTCGLNAPAGVLCWGSNTSFQLGTSPLVNEVLGGASFFAEAAVAPPTIVGSRSPDPNGYGWSNVPVVVSFTCSSAAAATCTAPVTVSSDGAGQSVAGTATDLYDQSATTTVTGISIDRVPPTIAGMATAPPGAGGWYRTSPTMRWSCDDDRSGIVACPADSPVEGEGAAVSVSATVSDRAGNATTGSSETVAVDLTPPSTGISSAPAWVSGSAALTLSPTDALSGVAHTWSRVDGAAAVEGTSLVVSGDGTHTVEYWSEDVAGNVESSASTTVKIDSSAPSIVASVAPAANADGWHRGPVTVTFDCGDEGGSEVASCSPPQSFTSEVDTVVTGSAVDGAGNTASAQATVRIDLHAPTITALVPDANAYGWFDAPVQVPFSCSDTGGSGVASCPAPVMFAGEGADQAVSGTGSDLAGNEGSASGATVSLDTTAPTISGAVLEADNGHGGYFGAVHVRWTCDDALSGVVSCPADEVVSGDGVHVVSASVTDRAGNATSAEVTVRIDHDPSTDPGIVHGTITDSVSGQPLAGALVRLWNPTGSTVLYSTTSGTDGRYTFPIVADGSYKLGVTKWGTHLAAYYPNAANTAVAQTIVVAHGTDRTADQALAPGHVLSGTLTAAGSGAPVSGATVRLSTGTWVTTDSAGHWEVPGLVTSSVTITYLALGFETATATAALSGPTVVDRSLTASAVSAAGMKGTARVASPAGPAGGVTVRIWLKDAGTYAATVTTNAQGRYQLPDLPVGRYEVDALRGGSRRWAPNAIPRGSASTTTITTACTTTPDLAFGDPCATPVDITF